MKVISQMLLALALASTAGLACGQAGTPSNQDSLSKFLVDITPGNVTAADIIGAGSSAIQIIQTQQDFVASIKAATTGDGKNGFGLSITPARTDFSAVALDKWTYDGEVLSAYRLDRNKRANAASAADGAVADPLPEKSPRLGLKTALVRAYGALTFSFATNVDTIASQSYRAYGVAVNASLYLDPSQDPVGITADAVAECKPTNAAAGIDILKAFHAADLPAHAKDDNEEQAALRALLSQRAVDNAKLQVPEIAACVAKAVKAFSPWNASRLSVSFGSGFLRAPQGATTYGLGQALSLNAQLAVGEHGVLNATYRHTEHSLDMTTVPTAPVYAKTNLVAVRATYGSQGDADTQALIEASNARKSSTSAYTGAFLYAIGIDQKLHDGAWLEFRFGRSRSTSSGAMTNGALLSLKLSPGAGLFN
jgi:hypothetical protein